MMVRKMLGAAAALALLSAAPAHAGATLDGVKQRDVLACGVNVGVAGFSLPDSQGIWRGMDATFAGGRRRRAGRPRQGALRTADRRAAFHGIAIGRYLMC